ncbi:MAG TPA: hypothetical protein VEF04_12285 [Blastocatellia bacterium]|nr:hypothetical protein [Blastocatellia bacterium]
MKSKSLQYSTQCPYCKVFNVPQMDICFVCSSQIELGSKDERAISQQRLTQHDVINPAQADKIVPAQVKEHIVKTKTV